MPLGILTKQASFAGIVTGSAGTATTRVTPQGKHYATWLIAKKAGGVAMTEAEMTASISSIEVLINGGQIHLCSPQKYRNLYFMETGEVLENGIIPILYYSPKLQNFIERGVTGIGCEDVSDFTINANLIGGAGNVLVSMECHEDYNPAIKEKVGTYRQIMELPRSITNTGEFEDNAIPTYGNDAALCAIYVYPGTNGVCDYVTLKTDDFERVSKASPAVLKSEEEMSGLHAISNVIGLHFDLGNSIGNAISMQDIKSIRCTTDWTVAPTTNTIFLLDFLRGVLTTSGK